MSTYGFLARPRWLALAFLVVIVVPSFLLLSRWQLHRLDERRASNAVISGNSVRPPVPVATLLHPGAAQDSLPPTLEWRPVTATGHYDAAGQVLVRQRPQGGQNGFWVATPLVTDDGDVLVVNRGWVAAQGGATAVQTPPDPPTGTVTVTGRLRPSQDAPRPQPSDLPAGQVTDLDVGLVAGDHSAYPAYLELTASDPAQDGLTLIPLPDLDEGPHLSYALQWIMFAGVAIGGFVMLVRRERELLAEEAAQETTRSDVA